ncbi:hypothetical protein TNCV_4913341 [Trichonephila clavipes]|nr:hypothetical protein TNCV_4913341 [Trichonephila clavipes]
MSEKCVPGVFWGGDQESETGSQKIMPADRIIHGSLQRRNLKAQMSEKCVPGVCRGGDQESEIGSQKSFDSLRWKAVGRLVASRSRAEVARWLRVAQTWAFAYRINSKQVVLSKKNLSSSSQSIDTCTGSPLGIGEQRLLSLLVTFLLCLEDEFPAVLYRLDFTPDAQSGAYLRLPPEEKIEYCGAEYICRGHQKNRFVFFSVISSNVPDKVILVEFSPGETMELPFIPPT